MSILPTITRDAPAVCKWEWIPEGDDWRVVEPDDVPRRCRWMIEGRKACGEPAVAALLRGTTKPAWWHYCGDHLYGRVLVNGVLYTHKLVVA